MSAVANTLFEKIDMIVLAKDLDRTLVFMYEDRDGVVTQRQVDPARRQGLRLLAWCCHREEYRRFDLRRAHAMKIGPSPNEVHLPLKELEEIGHE